MKRKSMRVKRRRFKQAHTLEERLAKDTERLRTRVKMMPLSPGRAEVVRRIRQNECAIEFCQMLLSPLRDSAAARAAARGKAHKV
jgi:hypothetical protein